MRSMRDDTKVNGKADAHIIEVTPYEEADEGEETALTKAANRYAEVREAVVSSDTYQKAAVWSEVAYEKGSWVWDKVKNVTWVVGTTALVAVLPLIFEHDREVSAEQTRRSSLRPAGAPAGANA